MHTAAVAAPRAGLLHSPAAPSRWATPCRLDLDAPPGKLDAALAQLADLAAVWTARGYEVRTRREQLGAVRFLCLDVRRIALSASRVELTPAGRRALDRALAAA